MAYVIAEPCIGVKDTACVDACPVDFIHPKKDESGFAEAELLYIDPVECASIAALACRSVPLRQFSPSKTCPRSGLSSRRGTRIFTRNDNHS